MIEQVFSPAGLSLANFQTEKAGILELRLVSGKMQKEGDLTICLMNRQSADPISTLSFSIWKYDAGHKEMFIGGLQGDKHISKETIVSLTRGLHGLRPKALLFYTLQQLGACWDITRLEAVSDNLHVYRHFQSHRNVSAVYDDFWIECGGALTPEGTFDLPAAFVSREISSIRVNKRQMYKRRYAMLNEIAGQIRSSLLPDEVSPRSADNVVWLEKARRTPDGGSIQRSAGVGS
jgi:uncharacterized protein VirK/YbjX